MSDRFDKMQPDTAADEIDTKPMDPVDMKPEQLQAQGTEASEAAFEAEQEVPETEPGATKGEQVASEKEQVAVEKLASENGAEVTSEMGAAAETSDGTAEVGADSTASSRLEEAREKAGSVYDEVKEKAGSVYGEVKEKAGSVYSEVKEKTGDAYEDLKEKAGSAYEEFKTETGSAYEEFRAGAGSVYDEIKGEARERSKEKAKNLHRDGRSLLVRMKLVAESFLANPQATLTAVYQDEDKSTAWGFYGLGLVLALLTGLFADGFASAVGTMVVTAVGMLIYPALTCAVANLRKNPVKMRDAFSVFWVRGIPLYVFQLVIAVLTLLELWPLILIVQIFSSALGLVLAYMATLALCGNNSKEALWTNSITNLIVIVIAVVIFLVIMFVIVGIFLGGLMYGRIDNNLIYHIIREFM